MMVEMNWLDNCDDPGRAPVALDAMLEERSILYLFRKVTGFFVNSRMTSKTGRAILTGDYPHLKLETFVRGAAAFCCAASIRGWANNRFASSSRNLVSVKGS